MAKPELFDELNALVRAIARQLELPEREVAEAFDQQRATVRLGTDDAGRKVIEITLDGRTGTVGIHDLAGP